MNWPETKRAFSLCLAGGFFGCCYLACLNPLFFHLAVLMAGVVLGVVANATMRSIEDMENMEESRRNISGIGRLMSFFPDNGKVDMAIKLRDLMIRTRLNRTGLNQGDYDDSEPDVFRVDNDNLWFVVNQGEHFAFKDPEFVGVTVVMKGDFAMRALALGFLPARPRFSSGDENPYPKKKRIEACYRKVHK